MTTSGALLLAALLAAAPDAGASPDAGSAEAAPEKQAAPEKTETKSDEPAKEEPPKAPSRGLLNSLFPALKAAGAKPKDGSLVTDYMGPGDAQLKISQDYLRQRDAILVEMETPLAALVEAARGLDSAGTAEERASIRQKLGELSGAPLDQANKRLAEALKLEDRRIYMVRKALELAGERKRTIPDVDPELVQQLYLGITSSVAGKAADRRIQAYRNLVAGIVAFLDNDVLTALSHIKSVTDDAPDLAIAHVYLGSISFLVQQPEQAIASWKRALELDPSNEAVRKALRDHAASARGAR
ncbi:MAG TPA: tetratricopeptide repeat protein [Myxococcales bacterium]